MWQEVEEESVQQLTVDMEFLIIIAIADIYVMEEDFMERAIERNT
jgi:hypothetical protein